MPGKSVPPPKRKYGDKKSHRLKDVDTAEQAMKAKALAWSIAAAVIGLAALNLAGGQAKLEPMALWLVRAAIVSLGALVYFLTMSISRGSGSIAGTIYHPSGRSSPVKHEYSYPESLAARGLYEEAVTAYEVAVSEFPEDPEPYIRIARTKRDKLSEFEDAVFWFKRARNDSEISQGQELVVTQEMIEIYRDKLGTPTRAIPELARIIDRFPDDPAAEWARQEMATLKEVVAHQEAERAGRSE